MFIRLSPHERRLVLRCCYLLIRAQWLVRVQPVREIIAGIDSRRSAVPGQQAIGPDAALRLLAGAGRRVRPRPACLSMALCGYALLRERGVEASCVIGGRRTAQGFEAHAWLEREGEVLLGGPVSGYQPIWRSPALPDGARC